MGAVLHGASFYGHICLNAAKCKQPEEGAVLYKGLEQVDLEHPMSIN